MNASPPQAADAMPGKKLSQDDLLHVFDKVGPLWENFRGQRLFMTGGTGFFGKWLLESLLYANLRLDLGCRITVLSRNPEDFAERNPHLNIPEIVSFVAGDIRNFIYPDGQYKFVIHAATDVVTPTNPLELFSSCIDGTRHVLDFARLAGCSDFLLVSSGAVYGQQPEDVDAVTEDYRGAPDPLKTKSVYGVGKRCAEWLANTYGEEHHFNIKIARCFAFVGPYLPLDKHYAIGNFIRDALADKDTVIEGDGTPYRSYLYAADLAIWLWTILLRGSSGVAYNVGGKEVLTLAELAQRVTQLAGSSHKVIVKIRRDPSKAGERYVPDVQKAEHELGLQTWISLDDAILRTLKW